MLASRRRRFCNTLPLLAGLSLALAASPAVAQVTAGHTLNYDAGLDTSPGNGVWEELNGVTTHDWTLGANVLHNAAPATVLTGIAGSYTFPTSGTDNAADKGATATYEGLTGNPTDSSASFELWFKPATLAGGNQVLWETGGGVSGASFTIRNGDTLRVELQEAAAAGRELVIETPLTGLSGEFISALATYDRNNPGTTDTLRLYINGQEVGASPDTDTDINDWAGANNSGIGGRNGDTGGTGGSLNLNTFNTFDGEIAIHRFYESTLTTAEVGA
ncbi:MAG: hypothetical protein KDA41_09270, partial [Planctomycetales bacterium]|nr:hypothetical protein [Planctomycetales bacterium]